MANPGGGGIAGGPGDEQRRPDDDDDGDNTGGRRGGVGPGDQGIAGAPRDAQPETSDERSVDAARDRGGQGISSGGGRVYRGGPLDRERDEFAEGPGEEGIPRDSGSGEQADKATGPGPGGQGIAGAPRDQQPETTQGRGDVGTEVGSGSEFAEGPGEEGIARDLGGATPNDPFRTDSPSERAFTDPERRQEAIEATVRQSEQLEGDDIIGFRETEGGGFRPLLTAEAKRGYARAATTRGSDVVDEEDIQGFRQTSEGAEPVLSGEARLELARENFGVDERVFAGTDRVPVGFEEGDVEFGLQGGEVQAELTDDAKARRAKRKAASDDPLRGSSDYVAETEDGEVSVRTRQEPVLEDTRERLGLDTPDESPVFRTLQRGSKWWQDIGARYAEMEAEQNPGDSEPIEFADGEEVDLDAADRGATQGFFAATNLAGAALDARTIARRSDRFIRAGIRDQYEAAESIATGEGDQGDLQVLAGMDLGDAQAIESNTNRRVVEGTVEDVESAYEENPDQTTGAAASALVVGAGLSAGGGIAAGRAARRATDAVRTAGARTFKLSDLTVDETVRYYNPDLTDQPPAGQFPGARDPSLYRRKPATAVRRQSQENLPDEIQARFEDAGIEETGETADLTKAVETEPESPGQGAGGYRAPESVRGEYELEGAFFSPELSPAFFRSNFGRPDFKLRPGLPSIGGRPTGVVARTRVVEPDADDLKGMNRELRQADDPVARTKPPGEGSPGEIEAVVPPETELVDVGGRGPLQSVARRLGIGSDFSVEIGNREIPLRPATDPDLRESGSESVLSRFARDDRGQVGARGDTDGGDLVGPRRYEIGSSRNSFRPGADRPGPFGSPTSDSAARRDDSDSSSSRRESGASVVESTLRPPSDIDSGFSSVPSSTASASGVRSGGSAGGGYSPVGSSDPGGSPGGYSPPGSPTETSSTINTPGGGSSVFVPPPPPPTFETTRVPDIEFEDTKRDRIPLFGGRRDPEFTDFLNPLSGELLETERESVPTELDEPAFLGFDSPDFGE